jgi:hypothetical protein
VKFARSGPWRSIRSFRLWTRTEPDPSGQPRVEVALRVELFEQIKYRPLLGLTQNKFSRLCETYHVGQTFEDERPQGRRAVVLSRDFLDGLLADPNGAAKPQTAGEQAT